MRALLPVSASPAKVRTGALDGAPDREHEHSQVAGDVVDVVTSGAHHEPTDASHARMRISMPELGRDGDRDERVGELLREQVRRCLAVLSPPGVHEFDLRLGLRGDDDLARHRLRSFASTSVASRPWPA